ncbi:LOW QUALITY PROTEIN: hypothetical protein CVT26_012495 [Gymnopilus dilepis]|uniref:Uncharacterized protein n=1 Tax=Gymnopilus dilepis TaxID=231916 RepID=A0A409YCY4_9AGAR|nr:LOW QUALITY PROTEIN: hypothetical protein CVT26_012495 [Gymnopilus dilepis]
MTLSLDHGLLVGARQTRSVVMMQLTRHLPREYRRRTPCTTCLVLNRPLNFGLDSNLAALRCLAPTRQLRRHLAFHTARVLSAVLGEEALILLVELLPAATLLLVFVVDNSDLADHMKAAPRYLPRFLRRNMAVPVGRYRTRELKEHAKGLLARGLWEALPNVPDFVPQVGASDHDFNVFGV